MISRNLKLIIALIIVSTITAYIVLVTIPTQLAKRSYEAAKMLGEDFKEAFQFTPEIIVAHTLVINQQTPILELAILSQNFEHRYSWTNTWLKSTKQINITGTFDVKVGFDLNEKFSIQLENGKATVQLPQPKVLSVEPRGDIVYRDESGIWNWVDTDDRSKATNAFIVDARKFAEQAEFIGDAKIEMEKKVRELLKSHAQEIEIRYAESFQLNDH